MSTALPGAGCSARRGPRWVASPSLGRRALAPYRLLGQEDLCLPGLLAPRPGTPYPQPQCARRGPEAPALTSLPSSGRMSPLSWLRLSLMRARRRFSSSGFRLCRRACWPRLRPGPSPRRSAPRRQSPGSYLAQLRRVPCPPRQPHSRWDSGAAVGPARGDLRASARTPKEDRGPQGGPVHDQSGSQWCARHACSPALRRQRARPAPPRGVRPPLGPTSAFVPARGGGGRGDGGAPGIPLQALASHLRRGRGPGAWAWGSGLGRLPPRAPAGVCVGCREEVGARPLPFLVQRRLSSLVRDQRLL